MSMQIQHYTQNVHTFVENGIDFDVFTQHRQKIGV